MRTAIRIARRLPPTPRRLAPALATRLVGAAAGVALASLVGMVPPLAAQGAAGVPDSAPIQEPYVRTTGVALQAGLGASALGIGGSASLTVPAGTGELTIRVAEGSEFEIFGFSESVREVALLYGVRLGAGGSTWARVSGGIGHARSVSQGEVDSCTTAWFLSACSYREVVDTSLGLALQFDGVWAFSDALGVGLNAYGSLNGARSMGGVSVGLVLGQLR